MVITLYGMPLKEMSDAGGYSGEETGLMLRTNELLNIKITWALNSTVLCTCVCFKTMFVARVSMRLLKR